MADHPHTVDRWDDATGENVIEQIASVRDYLDALETYRATVKRWPKDKITLRNRARRPSRSGAAFCLLLRNGARVSFSPARILFDWPTNLTAEVGI